MIKQNIADLLVEIAVKGQSRQSRQTKSILKYNSFLMLEKLFYKRERGDLSYKNM